MRVLFAAYCMLNNENGDSLIGVYKRCLRIGLALERRGHSVAILCPGRGSFRDATVEEAMKKLQFIDLPARALFHASSRYKRRCLRKAVRGFAPDVIVIGEVPLGGLLIDAAVVAAEMNISCVVLDNAYSPRLAAKFVHDHSAIADGIVLTGPSSFQMKHPPAYYCGIAPLMRSTANLPELAVRPSRPMVTALAYERKAEQLALALFCAMPRLNCELLLVSPDAAATSLRLADIPQAVREKITITGMPHEEELFAILARSQLVIGKCGFMQMSECVCLGTPFLGLHYRGCFSVWGLPLRALRFVGQTSRPLATWAVRLRFLRLLHSNRRAMRKLHDGNLDGLEQVCNFLETMPGSLRVGVTENSARAGYTRQVVQSALEARHQGRPIEVVWVRSAPLREMENEKVGCVVAGYRSGSRSSVAVLWTRSFSSASKAQRSEEGARDAGRQPLIWYRSPDSTLWLEEETGEEDLPKL